MELYLQFGHGMKQIAIDLSKTWNGATVILSPRDISPEQLSGWRGDFEKAGIKSLFDPQIYFPKSKHDGLLKYDYWDSSFGTKLDSHENFEDTLIKKILKYNKIAGCSQFIIPSAMYNYNEKWLNRWGKHCEKLIAAAKSYAGDMEHFLTLTLPEPFLLQKESEIENYIREIEKMDVDGFYIVASQPKNQYLVDTPVWLSNLMLICAACKINGKKVIMGYGNHQLLCLSAAKVDALATGTYLNVRHFFNKFDDRENESIKKRSIWYYYPAALSEYKIGFLDVAYNTHVIQMMKPSKDMDLGFVDLLFGDVQPSLTAFKESMAFKHYLHCVKVQANSISKKTYDETISANEVLLETAMRMIENMEKKGVYAQSRSFKDMVDVNRSALQRLDAVRGFQLRKEW